MKDETYKTSDLYLAAYLQLIGHRLVKIQRANVKQAEFLFMDKDECEYQSEQFYGGEGKQFWDYAKTFKDLKAAMYNELDGTVSKYKGRKAKKENLDYKL